MSSNEELKTPSPQNREKPDIPYTPHNAFPYWTAKIMVMVTPGVCITLNDQDEGVKCLKNTIDRFIDMIPMER